MKTWTILLTVSALAAVVTLPLVNAEESCGRAELADGAIAHPTKAETFIYFGPDPAKIGEWTNTNGRAGLQTIQCLAASGSVRYAKDFHAPLVA